MTESKPLSVLIAGISWPPETFIMRLICGLRDAGVAITVGSARPPQDAQGRQASVGWLPMPAWEGSAILRLARLARMTARAGLYGRADLRLFASMKPSGQAGLPYWYRLLPLAGRRWDIIYFPWNSAAIAYLPVFETGCPVVVSCRGTQVNVAPHNPLRADIREGLRVTFERARAIHCVSEAIKREAEQYGLDATKAWVIRPAIDPAQFTPPQEPIRMDGAFRIVTTGSLVWGKGLEYALLAVRGLLDRGVLAHLDIVGDGPERQRVLYTIHDLGLEQVVCLRGRLSPPDVVRHLQQADAFLLSSLSEGISNAVLEAMACELPVVTTDCGGMREAVTDGVEGFVVPTRDPRAMTGALATLSSNADLRRQIGLAARTRVLREFTLDRQVEQWMELFRGLLARQKAQEAA